MSLLNILFFFRISLQTRIAEVEKNLAAEQEAKEKVSYKLFLYSKRGRPGTRRHCSMTFASVKYFASFCWFIESRPIKKPGKAPRTLFYASEERHPARFSVPTSDIL